MTEKAGVISNIYYGWWNAGVAFLSLLLIFGTPTMLLPFIYGPVIDEFGWSRAEVTGIASFKFLSAALSALLSGYLVDRYGVRAVVIACCVITGLAMCGFIWVDSLFRYYVVGILLGLAATAIMVAVKTLMSRWFNRNQGLSIGVVMMGSSVAGIIVPFIAVPLIDWYGWRETFAITSLGIWIIALPLFLLVAREVPTAEELNRELGGKGVVDTPASERGALHDTLADVIKQPMFWIIVAAVFIMSLVDQGMNQHTILFIETDLGLGRDLAARAFSAIFAAGVFAKVAFGWFFDRTSIRGIQGCYLLMGISIALAFPISGALTMYLFAVLRGTAHGGLLIQTAILAKHCFGPAHLGKLIGIFTAVASLGFAAGPLVVGWFYDWQNSYRLAFMCLIGLCLVSALLLFWLVPAYRESITRSRTADALI